VPDGFGKDVWAEVNCLQRDENGICTSQIYRNKAGWWNSSNLMQDWLQFHFGFRHEMKENPILLIVDDDFSSHWTDGVQRHAEKLNVHLMRVLPGYTCFAAPPDVAWNSPLKKFLRKEWLTILYNQFKAPRKPNEAFKLNLPKRPLLFSWALRAWESVSTRTIAAGFKGVGIETNLFPPKTLPGPLEKVDAELEELSNSVFDELAKLELIDKEFTISSEDSDAFNEEERKSAIIIDLDLDGEEKKEINEYDDEEDDEEQGDSSSEDCGEERRRRSRSSSHQL
jgi:hypothetical protein